MRVVFPCSTTTLHTNYTHNDVKKLVGATVGFEAAAVSLLTSGQPTFLSLKYCIVYYTFLENMDEVIHFIKKSLPQLSQLMLEKVKEKLVDIGVCDFGDLKLIQEEDLLDVLKPIQIRKIMQQCKEG